MASQACGEKVRDVLKHRAHFSPKKYDAMSTLKGRAKQSEREKQSSNPFSLPHEKSWVNLWKKEKSRQLERRRSERQKKIHEKHTFTSRVAHLSLPAIRKKFLKVDEKDAQESDCQEKAVLFKEKGKLRPAERIFTHDFIQRKRDIFLVEYALLTRRQEVEKQEAQVLEHEKKFARRVKRLHEDAVLFDEFLKATDDAAVERMKIAENETKLKLDKVAEYKSMSSKVMALKSEIFKMEETLMDYLNCKTFLFHVYENNKQNDTLASDTMDRKAIREMARENQPKTEKKRKSKRSASKSARKSRNSHKSHQRNRSLAPFGNDPNLTKIPEEWNGEDFSVDDTRTRLPFLTPQELLTILKTLEENNVKLICKFQQTEEELEAVKKLDQKMTERITKEKAKVVKHVRKVEMKIAKYDERANKLSLMYGILRDGNRDRDSSQALADLEKNVEKVYLSMFDNAMAMDALPMLTYIEKRMDELLDQVDSCSAQSVQNVQKAIDKVRRRQAREENITMQKWKQEERVRKAMERAKAGTLKRAGKWLMFRSMLPQEKENTSNEAVMRSNSEDSLDYFLKE